MAVHESRSAFRTWNDRTGFFLFPGVHLDSVGGDQVLLCRVRYDPDTHVKRHSHPETEQVMLVLDGEVTVDVDGEQRSMGPGDVSVVNRGLEHELWSTSGCTFIEALAPVLLDHVGDRGDLVLGPDRGAGHVER